MRDGQKDRTLSSRLKGLVDAVASSGGAGAVQGRLNDDGSSFSGGERDHLFLNKGGRSFYDVAAIAAIDSPGDGRSAAVLDIERDGWNDLVLANANTPQLELFRNAIGSRGAAGPPPIIALRFVGGNREPRPSREWSARDGFGAAVTLELEGATLHREARAGEGLAAQNSPTLVVGTGARPARGVKVTWPSGKVQQLQNVTPGTLLTVFENPAEAPDASGFRAEPYLRSGAAAARPGPRPAETRLELPVADGVGAAGLRLFTTMATWCQACRDELPQLERLRAAFDTRALALYAVPIDEEDDPAKLQDWMAKLRPPYALLSSTSAAQRETVKQTVLDLLKQEAVPAAFLTDTSGRILHAQFGPPSVSKLRELIERRRDEPRERSAGKR